MIISVPPKRDSIAILKPKKRILYIGGKNVNLVDDISQAESLFHWKFNFRKYLYKFIDFTVGG